jgi:uncharacterized protein (DUF1501 family)
MAAIEKDPVLVVVQLSGGNDYLNTVIPYNNGLYRDNRKAVSIGDTQDIRLSLLPRAHEALLGRGQARHPARRRLSRLAALAFPLHGHVAHLRGRQGRHRGLLGRVVREFDPKKENVVTAVSFGPCLFRALSVPGVPVACVAGPLETYGFLPSIQDKAQRLAMLDRFSRMYTPVPGSGVMEYLGTTGLDSLKGADILKVAPGKYKSDAIYPDTSIARKLKGIAQVHFADLGTRVFYCDHGSFDTHAGQNPIHTSLWHDLSKGLEVFMADLRAHDGSDNVVVLVFSEFGRRVRDNGSGTDHGAAGVTFVLGDKIKGGHYGDMPSLDAGKLVQGDLNPNMDFRGIYSTILERWMRLDPVPIVNGKYEQPAFLN